MKTVYVVQFYIEYEGFSIEAIHTSLEHAIVDMKERAEALNKKYRQHIATNYPGYLLKPISKLEWTGSGEGYEITEHKLED